MICFRNLYLWYSDTTCCDKRQEAAQLWFAFEIYIFDILIQQAGLRSGHGCSCDLLSKFISLIFWYNLFCMLVSTESVVICFRNLYLWYSDTTTLLVGRRGQALWFAFEIYIFDILIQQRQKDTKEDKVVICFRNLYLWYSDTTGVCWLYCIGWLWFAFEIYIFDILIQPVKALAVDLFGCDLLSKFISLIFWYNLEGEICLADVVVICFRNLYLWYSDTTVGRYTINVDLLWFAFEIYIFDILIQQKLKPEFLFLCCDLLSKFISLIFWYNLEAYLLICPTRCDLLSKFISLIFWYNVPSSVVWKDTVVICFRNLYLWYSDTTIRITISQITMLWFAFEIYIFDILIQHRDTLMLFSNSCDLLSKFISLIFWYNTWSVAPSASWVVICFRNLYLWYSDTTIHQPIFKPKLLWFAFEIYIFDILIQLVTDCERWGVVVICFRNLYLWYSDTTCRNADDSCWQLWFAFEIYIFDILIQLST